VIPISDVDLLLSFQIFLCHRQYFLADLNCAYVQHDSSYDALSHLLRANRMRDGINETLEVVLFFVYFVEVDYF